MPYANAAAPSDRAGAGEARQRHDVHVPTHVGLLRGINVAGRNRVSMADLRAVVASLGHTDVATYIQSGNVLFTTKKKDTTALARAIERAMAKALSVSPGIVVVSRDELARVVDDNPFPGESNPKYVHVIFLAEKPGPEMKQRIAAAQRHVSELGSRDSARVAGQAVFLHTPDGFGTSKLAAKLMGNDRAIITGGTARNWSTVTKLLSLLDA
jgi:uncharacterized protein (DUF1697 family)